jgi:hypothetical protein
VQIPLTQSDPALQDLPTAQCGQLPPQSTSVSAPFFAASVHVGTAHSLFLHLPLVQSESTVQGSPSPHRGQALPPQSMPVSFPFFTPSVHVGTAHALELHTPLAQSVASSHRLPVAQGVHVPPQSTSLSRPFIVWSVQLGI